MGIIATVIKPRSLVAQANPSLSIICTVKKGKLAEKMKRMKVEAARTEAP
jgi:hypothetical protein